MNVLNLKKMKDKLKPKDAKAKKRCDDELQLRTDIAELIRQFSKKYDVECVDMEIIRNEWYGRQTWNCPMYNIRMAWKFDYLAHDLNED